MTTRKSLFNQIEVLLAVAVTLLATFPITVLSQACVQPPSDLVVWLQAEGNANDVFGLSSGVIQGNLSFSAGEVGQAFNFDGTSAWVTNPATASLNVGTNSGMTIECWIQPANASVLQDLVEWNNGFGNPGVHLWLSQPSVNYGGGPGCLFLNLVDTQGNIHPLATAGGIIIGIIPQHIAATYDKASGVATLYRNGVAVVSQNLGSFTPQTSYALSLGRRPSPGDPGFYKGLMDEVCIYGRALTGLEIQAVYNSLGAGKCGSGSPVITMQPHGVNLLTGNDATFSAGIAGIGPFRYQWRLEGTNLINATNALLTLTNVQLSDAGNYSLVVSNAYGGALSSNALLTASVPSCVSARPNLVTWFQAENGANDTMGLNQGVLQGGVGFVHGKVGNAFSLNGTNSYVNVPASASLNIGTNLGFSIEGWIKPADLSSARPIMEWNNSSGGLGVHLWLSQAPQNLGSGIGCLFVNMVDVAGGNHGFTTSNNLLNTNSFQHFALTYDYISGNAVFYYNGAVAAAQAFTSFTPQTSYNLFLGGRTSGSAQGYYSGLMDEISLYNRALSASEIQAIYNADTAGKCRLVTKVVSQPQSQTVFAGQPATISAVAVGAAPLSFQWRFNGNDLLGATNSAINFIATQLTDAGIYSVRVSNIDSSDLSSNAVLTVNQPACTLAGSNLVGWWQAEGDAGDSTALNNGQLQGGLSFTGGEAGQCFSFDGATSFVSIPASASLNVGTNSGMTIECWVRPVDNNTRALVEWNTGAFGFGAHLWLSQSVVSSGGGPGCIFINLVDVGGNYHTFTTPGNLVKTNGFQHVAATYDKASGVVVLYYNGAVVAAQTIGSFTPQTSYNLYVGKRVSGGDPGYYYGQLDELSLYSRALAPAEIQAIYIAGIAGKCGASPEFLVNPKSQVLALGTNLTLSTSLRGNRPMSYSWHLNGFPVANATNFTLTLTNIQPSLGGTYYLAATNSSGFAISSNAIVTVKVVSVFGNGQLLTNSQYSFGGSATIQLTNAYGNGIIFYSLDGSAPDFSSPIYTGPFNVNNSSIIRTFAFSPDFTQSVQSDPITVLILPTYSLSMSTAGGGTVLVNPTNSARYLSNTLVTLVALPTSGWSFFQWLGDAGGTNRTNTVLMTRNSSVQAVFGTTLNTSAVGGGSVVLNPGGGLYPFGTVVQVSAVPQAGNYLVLWGNAASGNANPMNFLVSSANPTISSLFSGLSGGRFALSVVPVGRGKVAVNPQFASYASGTNVMITATPDAGQTFVNWSGDATGTVNPLTVGMTQNRTVFANFTRNANLGLRGSQALTEGVQLTLSGEYGGAYRMDTSSNLFDWVPGAIVTNTYGTLQLIDASATNASQRFYRGIQLLP